MIYVKLEHLKIAERKSVGGQGGYDVDYMNASVLLAVVFFFAVVALVASAFGMQIVWKYPQSRSTLMAERSRRPMYLDMFGLYLSTFVCRQEIRSS